MRPINLKFTAFGPYADTQTVDFTQMQTSTMFVINGPTGSGKTTIFDAISFALYGSASGSDRSAEMFRSEFAAPDIQTSVEFSFELRNQIYNIKRLPSQLRPKKRGEGFTKVESSVVLSYGETVISAQNEVNTKISDLLGLTKDQFKQIVLLPQGEFKKLLMSDSKSKEEIFRKIFNTSHIKQIQDKLRHNSSELKRQIEDTDLKIKTILNNYEQGTTKRKLEQLHPQLKTNLEDLETEKSELIGLIETQNKLLEAEAKHLENTKQLELINKQLTKLEAQSAEYTSIRNFVEQLENVITLNTALINLKDVERDIETVTYEIAEVKTILADNQNHLAAISTELTAITTDYQQLDQSREQLANQNQLLLMINAQSELQQRVEAGIKSIPKLKSQIEKTNSQIIENTQQIENANQNEVTINRYQTNLESLNKDIDRVSQQLTTTISIKGLEDEIKECLELVQTNQNQLEIENSRLNGMRHAIITAQAGKLASNLKSNDPCPVCGSVEHPKLATIPDQLPSQSELDDQEQVALQLNSSVSSLLAKIEEKQKQITNLNSDYELEPNVNYRELYDNMCKGKHQLKMEMEKLSSKFDLNQLSVIKERLQTQLSEQRIELEKLETSIQVNQSQVTLDKQTLDSKQAVSQEVKQLTAKIKSVDERYTLLKGQEADLQVRIGSSKSKLDILNSQLRTNHERSTGIEEQVEQLYNQIGHSNAKQYILMLENATQYKTSLTEYDKQVTELKLVQSQTKKMIVDYSPIDHEATSEIKTKSEIKLQTINELVDQYKLDDANITRDLNALAAIDNSYQRLSAEYQLVADLSDIANGKTISKISFERYMLANYFKQIIIRANIYFKTMTNNRFELLHKETGRGNASRGLDLNIVDNYTSSVRDVKSLSGGESFKAALAMALGLSDIVQMNSGGIQIDTIFIDEGFGSLDIDSLNTAIDTLISIQDEGRMVGIISHVEELKNQISNKIEITPSQNGSRLKTKFS